MVKRTAGQRQQLIRECQASGKPAKSWCRENDVSYSTYTNWLKSINPVANLKPSEQPAQWAEIKPSKISEQRPSTPPEGSPVTIRLRGGYEISVDSGIDAELLERVLRVVSRLC
jgi:hypothetical protein